MTKSNTSRPGEKAVKTVKKKAAKSTAQVTALPIRRLKPQEREVMTRADWDDEGTFPKICKQFGLKTSEVLPLMRKLVTPKDFRRWKRKTEDLGHLKPEVKKSHRGPKAR